MSTPSDYTYDAPAPKQSQAMAVTGMVLGIVGILTACFAIGGALGLAAIILGVLGLKAAKRMDGRGRGFAITGIVTGAIALVLGALATAYFVWAYSNFGSCMNETSPQAQQACINEKVAELGSP